MTFKNFQAPEFHPPAQDGRASWTVSAEDVSNTMRIVCEIPVLKPSKFEIEAARKLALSFIRGNTPQIPFMWRIEYHDGSYIDRDCVVCPPGWEGRAFPLFRERDNCEVCFGAKGGVLGNELRIDGVIVCDYCHAANSKLSKSV